MKLSQLKKIITEELRTLNALHNKSTNKGCKGTKQLSEEEIRALKPMTPKLISELNVVTPGVCVAYGSRVCADGCDSNDTSCAGSMCECYLRASAASPMDTTIKRR